MEGSLNMGQEQEDARLDQLEAEYFAYCYGFSAARGDANAETEFKAKFAGDAKAEAEYQRGIAAWKFENE